MMTNIPCVRTDQERRTTIVVHRDAELVHHIPLKEHGIAIWHSDPVVFERDYPRLALEHGFGYRAPKAAEKFLKYTHLPMSSEAKRVLEKVAARVPVVPQDLLMQVEEVDMAAKKVAAKKGAKKAANGAAPRKGRAGKYGDDLKISVKSKENPKRGESAKRFGYYKSGMTVGEYIKKGGLRSDIAWDVEKDYISVR